MKTKSGSIFYKNKRIANMQGIEYSIKPNDGQEITDGGVHNTDGVTTTTVTCNALVPVRGVGIDVVRDAVEHNDVDLTLAIIDGKMHELLACRATEINFTGEIATGKLTGRFSWHGPGPKISGAPI